MYLFEKKNIFFNYIHILSCKTLCIFPTWPTYNKKVNEYKSGTDLLSLHHYLINVMFHSE